MNYKLIISTFLLLSSCLLTACGTNHFTGSGGKQEFKEHSRVTVKNPGKFELIHYPQAPDMPGYSMATVNGREFAVTGDVVIPSAQSVYLLTHFEIKPGETVLDIGTGSGVQAVFAAENASYVLATDISPLAVDVAKYNIGRHKLSGRIETRVSDLFSAIKPSEKFDVILFNIDYPYNQEVQGLWEVHERFFANVRNHLKPGGRIYYQAGLLGNIKPINYMVRNNELRIISMRMDAALEVAREPIVFLIKRGSDL